jgi:hypothetical protein
VANSKQTVPKYQSFFNIDILQILTVIVIVTFFPASRTAARLAAVMTKAVRSHCHKASTRDKTIIDKTDDLRNWAGLFPQFVARNLKVFPTPTTTIRGTDPGRSSCLELKT